MAVKAKTHKTPSSIVESDATVSGGSLVATANDEDSHEVTRVLVADGNATVRKILRHNFDTLGWTTLEAEDGEQALRIANESPAPHAILLDLNLRKIDGYEICRRLKADISSRVIPVVALTAKEDQEEKVKALDAGVDEFLSKPINRAEMTVRLRSLVRMHRYNQEMIGAESVAMALARAVASKDGYSSGHVEQVANYSMMLGQELGLDSSILKIIKYGAILHNVGKIAIPDSVLEKTGPLTPREKALFQQHPRVGCDICAPLKPLRPILPIIRHHKEHWDGSGFPDALRGNEIPVGAQIVGVVDVYTALTTDRPFRKAISHEDALDSLRQRGQRGMHDPKLVEHFITALEKRIPSSSNEEEVELVETS